MMQNDALEQIRKAESDNQTRIQTATEQAADRLRQASGDREVRLREKEAALRRELTDACAETEKKAAAIRSRSISDADTHAREIRASVSRQNGRGGLRDCKRGPVARRKILVR